MLWWLVAACYAGLMAWLIVRIVRRSPIRYPLLVSESLPAYTVLVPFRNEGEHLPALLWALLRQTHLPTRIILINDHSTDDWQDTIALYLQAYPDRIQVIENEGWGKKQALATGLQHANTEWLLWTDADSMPPPEWARELLAHHSKYDLIGGAVVGHVHNFVTHFHNCDFIAQQGLSWAFPSHPVTVSGASLAVRKAAWESVLSEWLRIPTASGDDVFLLYLLQKRQRRVYVYQTHMPVTTASPTMWRALWRQRVRWAGKIRYYRRWSVWMVLVWVGITQALFILALFKGAIVYLLTKIVADALYLLVLTFPYTYWGWIRHYLWMALLHPIVSLFVGTVAIFTRSDEWR